MAQTKRKRRTKHRGNCRRRRRIPRAHDAAAQPRGAQEAGPRPGPHGAPRPAADVAQLDQPRAAGQRLHVDLPARGHEGQGPRRARVRGVLAGAVRARRLLPGDVPVAPADEEEGARRRDRRADVHRRSAAGELLHRARCRQRPGGDRRSGRRGRADPRRAPGAGDHHRRGDPAHPHPLRPRRRGGGGRAGDGRPGLLPRARGRDPGQHQRLRALSRLRPVRELRRRPDGRRRRDARARRIDASR